MEHHIELTNNEPNTLNDSPLTGVNTLGSDKGSLERTELMDLVQKLSQRVLDLEKEKTAQAKEVAGLKKRVTKLEQLQRSRTLKTHPFSDFDELDMENVKDDAKTQGRNTEKVNTVGEGVSTASVPETVSTAAPRTLPTTITVFDNEDVTMTMAQTLIKMKEEKAKEKDKEKGILQEAEPVKKTKGKDQGDAQIERDVEVALRLQA
ncbi:hypothetical protein Tco_0034714, partial [Tanacetum coccineum]